MQSPRQIKSTARGCSAVSFRSSTKTVRSRRAYSSHIQVPFADADAFCGLAYAPEDIYVSDSKTGSIVKLEFIPVSGGKAKTTEVITGFGVNKGSGWGVLGPSGIQYNSTRTGSLCNDTLYIVDGVDNTVVAVSTASSLLQKDEIVVQARRKDIQVRSPASHLRDARL